MKWNLKKVLALSGALVLIGGLAWFSNALNGNPISKMLAQSTAERYLAEHYGDTDYYIDRVSYNFKDGNYHAFVRSPSSVDTTFTLSLTMLGSLQGDTYDHVLSGWNTALRLDGEYRALADRVLEDPAFPYQCHIGYGCLEIYPTELLNSTKAASEVPDYALNQDELILDHIYDIPALGRQAGHLILYLEAEQVSFESAANIMLDLKARFDEAGVPFAAMDLTVQPPRAEDGQRPDGEIRVEGFPCDAFVPDGLVDRIREADQELEEYYAQEDAERKRQEAALSQ